MALSSPRAYFGVHSFSPYNRTTGEFYGTAKVIKGSSFNLTGETVDLTGGPQSFPWQVEDGLLSGELALTFAEFPSFFYELFLGKAPTDNAAEATGDVSTLTDKNGTVVDASTGIASVGAKSGSESDMKFGKYVVKVVSSSTVDVYASSDIDFARGTDKEFASDLLKITSSALTISTGAAVEVPGFGIELTGGSGSISLTTGNTATFEVRPPNSKSTTVTIGSDLDVMPNFGALLYGQRNGAQEMVELDIFNIKGVGLPHNFNPKAFAETEVTAKAYFDSAKNGVFSLRTISPT